jgi:hypothetical protein
MTINSSAGSIAYTFVMVNAKVTGSDNWLISKIMLGTTQIFY